VRDYLDAGAELANPGDLELLAREAERREVGQEQPRPG
jgi:hypothetical protein